MSALTPTPDIAAGGWSIEVEVVFYLLFPMLLVASRSRRVLVGLLVGALVLRVIYVDSVWPVGADAPNAIRYFQMPSFLVFFLGGMLVAVLRPLVSVDRSQWPLLGAGVVLVGIVATSVAEERTLQTGVIGVGLVLLSVVGVALASLAANPVTPALQWLYASLGSISYPVYLLHPLVFIGLRHVPMPDAARFVATIVITCTAGWCSYRWFERPAGVWIRRIVGSTSRRRSDGAISQSPG